MRSEVVIRSHPVHSLEKDLHVGVCVEAHGRALPPPSQQRPVRNPGLKAELLHGGEVGASELHVLDGLLVLRDLLEVAGIAMEALVRLVEVFRAKNGCPYVRQDRFPHLAEAGLGEEQE